jgi:SAM-dependent methyltransferase
MSLPLPSRSRLASAPESTVASMVEHDALSVTREAYDAAASLYAQRFRDELQGRPLDRGILSAFAEIVSARGDGQVADLGCGPGHITARLDELGLAAFGVDASSAMIELARQAYPGLRFDVGSMAALNIADGVLGGILSRWSIIHTPPQELPVILAEFHRVLAPGGHLLVGFSASDDPSHLTQVFDHTVALAYRWSPDHLAAMLREAGLAEVARMVREPQPTDRRQFQEIHLLARKPEAGDGTSAEAGPSDLALREAPPRSRGRGPS